MKKRKRNRLLIILALVFLVSVATVTWWTLGHNEDSNASVPTKVGVVRRDFSSSVLATGEVKPQVGAEVRVGSRISGRVERLYANIGDFLKKGQVIAELEKADLEAVVSRCQADVAVVEEKITDAEAREKLADIGYQRQQNLIKEDFTSQQAVDRALKEKESARAGVHLANRQLDAARATLKEAQVKLSYATITAPMSGVVASVSTQQGETVAAGLNAPTFVTIIDLKRLQVDAYVDEVDIGKVNVGQQAVFTVDSFPAREFKGKVVAIYPKAVIQENVVNYDVVVEITTTYDGLLRPEMTTGVTIFLETRTNVLAIPAKAVNRERGKNVAYVLADGKPEAYEIKVGWKDGQWIEIVAGLDEGQTVLLGTPFDKK